MNFVLASLSYVVMGALIGIGMVQAVQPKPGYAILFVGFVAFFGLFVKAGCLSSHD